MSSTELQLNQLCKLMSKGVPIPPAILSKPRETQKRTLKKPTKSPNKTSDSREVVENKRPGISSSP